MLIVSRHGRLGRGTRAIAAGLFLLAVSFSSFAQAKRIVVIKADGLSYEILDRYVREHDPRTGKSVLPWFEYVFYQNGTRLENFYTRGISLSAPSWSVLDTGQHVQIKGNVEFDRDIFESYDYLNSFIFFTKRFTRDNPDTQGAEVLDSLKIPLLMDAYEKSQRLTGFQLYQRGTRFATLQRAAATKFLKKPRQKVEDIAVGFELHDTVDAQVERELIEQLGDSKTEYLDLLDADFDHMAHGNNDQESLIYALKRIDAQIGRLWVAIQQSPLAAETALVIVSDHGINTDSRVYSQGFNLVRLLNSANAGGHHVVTRRRQLNEYAIKGMSLPLWPIISSSPDSSYLKGESAAYPTALLDSDGNERADIHFRSNDLNRLHILLKQIRRKDTNPEMRRALQLAFIETLDRNRQAWQTEIDQLNEELPALKRAVARQEAFWETRPKKVTPETMGVDSFRRAHGQVIQWNLWLERYGEYVATMQRLLSLRPEAIDSSRVTIEQLIPRGAMGANNTVYDLQNYVVGLDPGGAVLKSDGTLDLIKSFRRVNYLDLFVQQAVRNNVQDGVSNHPIDFVATRIARDAIAPSLGDGLQPDGDAVWLYGGPDRQALILPRIDSSGELMLRYLPIANLRQDANEVIRFQQIDWQAGLPLKMLEDPRLNIGESRVEWLSAWHTDREWLVALHKTRYSNGLIGLHEQFTLFPTQGTDLAAGGISSDERLLRRFWKRKRELVEADLMLSASDHWNFDMRGFNPGGNHGSFFRISTHSTLMFAGGDGTGIPRGLAISTPYDSLSFTPTVLALAGKVSGDGSVPPNLAQRGFVKFPGPVVREVLGSGGNTGASQNKERQ